MCVPVTVRLFLNKGLNLIALPAVLLILYHSEGNFSIRQIGDHFLVFFFLFFFGFFCCFFYFIYFFFLFFFFVCFFFKKQNLTFHVNGLH